MVAVDEADLRKCPYGFPLEEIREKYGYKLRVCTEEGTSVAKHSTSKMDEIIEEFLVESYEDLDMLDRAMVEHRIPAGSADFSHARF